MDRRDSLQALLAPRSPMEVLTKLHMLDILFNMKKLTARQFQHTFSKTTEALKPGESVTITKHGRPLGVFTRLPKRRVKTPDFLANLEKVSYSVEVGDAILKQFYDRVS